MDETQKLRKWLPIGWKIMAVYGLVFIFIPIYIFVTSYFDFPNQPHHVFGSLDEKFTGVTWNQMMSLSSDLGLWIILTMVAMCGMMLAVGLFTFLVSYYGYREGQRWAWKTLVIVYTFLIAFSPLAMGSFYVARGLPPVTMATGVSGVISDGFYFVAIIFFYFGLWLPRKELVD